MFDLFTRDDDRTPGKILFRKETEYGTYVIKNGNYKGDEARLYEVDGVRESATFFDDKKYDMVFDYIKGFSHITNEAPDAGNMLMFGGAGFQYPKHVISHYSDIRMDVIEVNPLAVDIARRFFYLNDLEKDFKAESSGRLRIFIEDGMDYLRESSEKYDIIINDAYHSDIPDQGLASVRGLRLIMEHMEENGVYGFNLITSIEGENSMPLKMNNSMLNSIFTSVKCFRCTPGAQDNDLQNVIFVCRMD